MHSDLVLLMLLNRLWGEYVQRVPYAHKYAEMVLARGGEVHNDHIAFRTLNTKTGTMPAGVPAIARVFTALGYVRKDEYPFTEKKLTAWHYEHRTNPDQPKIFISQLEVDELDADTAEMIREAVIDTVDPLSREDIELLSILNQGRSLSEQDATRLVDHLCHFFARPWEVPSRDVVEKVNKTSQYAAWTLLHGNSVNHFTAHINKQHVHAWKDIEDTANALKDAGIPMKAEFEGEAGSKLRQTSTEAVMIPCEVQEKDGSIGEIMWSYAYYELAERGMVPDKNGKMVPFNAFLGEQATNLFDMTKVKK